MDSWKYSHQEQPRAAQLVPRSPRKPTVEPNPCSNTRMPCRQMACELQSTREKVLLPSPIPQRNLGKTGGPSMRPEDAPVGPKKPQQSLLGLEAVEKFNSRYHNLETMSFI